MLAEPAVQQRLANLGLETAPMTSDDFQKLLRADWDTAGAIVRASGAKLE